MLTTRPPKPSCSRKEFFKNNLGNDHFVIPTSAHNVKKIVLLKHIKIMKAGSTFFGLQRNHHQGATAST